MTGHNYASTRKSKYTKATVQGWRKIMRDNEWNQTELAAHLGVKPNVVGCWFDKEAHGELRD